MSFVKHAVIAAAGLGSRLGRGKPKCLVKIQGKTILHHLTELLQDVPDVRVVVGFMEHDVIAELYHLRKDAIIVRNPDFRSTTTLHSYALGAKYILEGECLFMDADLLVNPESFQKFLKTCRPAQARLAITPSKTKDAVYVDLDNQGRVEGFNRTRKTEFEWSNISWLPHDIFEKPEDMNVYEYLRKSLPMHTTEIESYEIDTEEDLIRASHNAWRIMSPDLVE